MADDPSNGELARRLDEVLRLLQGLLSVDVYTTDQRHWERRFTDMERDLEAERAARQEAVAAERAARQAALDAEQTARKDAIKELGDRVDKRMDTGAATWKQVLLTGVLPSIFFLITITVTVLLALRGGSGK